MANNTGTFFNVNDNDGIPLVGVSTDGKVMINHLYGNCLIGSTSVTGTATQPLQVTGGAYVSGNVGIGTTNPPLKLTVVGNIKAGYEAATGIVLGITPVGLPTNDANSYILWGDNATFGGANGDLIYISRTSTDTSHRFYTGTTTPQERLRITSTGNVGIGTNNPTSKLHVQGTGQFVAASSSSATNDAAIYASTPLQTVSAFFGQNTSVSGLTENQYSTAIRFNGGDVAWGDMAYYPNQGGQGHFRFSLAGSSVDTSPDATVGVGALYSVGNVGIGITNPTSKLHVVGGDIKVGIDTSQGIILTSQNGTKYRLIVSNAGVLSTVLVP